MTMGCAAVGLLGRLPSSMPNVFCDPAHQRSDAAAWGQLSAPSKLKASALFVAAVRIDMLRCRSIKLITLRPSCLQGPSRNATAVMVITY